MDFGLPPTADETKKIIEQRLAERVDAGLQETLTVGFRDKPETVAVIDIEIEHLYFNPGTHRVRAQREHDAENDRRLEGEPWGEAGQRYLTQLLAAKPSKPSERDPDFEELKENLQAEGQNDPGLITRSGIIVDGNTRAAALKELGKTTMRVGVLPESTTWKDIASVELNLQMRRDHRRDYTYINRLLAYEELHAGGLTPAQIAPLFRVKAATIDRDLWVLNELRELIARSRVGKSSMRLMDFEQDQEKLREIHRAYHELRKNNSLEHAETVKESRLSALVLGFSKTDIRLIEDDFQERYLEQKLSQEVLEDINSIDCAAEPEVSIPGLGVSVASGTNGGSSKKARKLTDSLLRSRTLAGSGLSDEGDPVAAQRLKDVKSAMDSSLKLAGSNQRVKKQERATADRVETASEELRQCAYELVRSRAKQAIDVQAFDDALVELRDSLHVLAVQAAKLSGEPGEGVEWLFGAARRENR